MVVLLMQITCPGLTDGLSGATGGILYLSLRGVAPDYLFSYNFHFLFLCHISVVLGLKLTVWKGYKITRSTIDQVGPYRLNAFFKFLMS